MTEILNNGPEIKGQGPQASGDTEVRIKQLSERFRQEVMTDKVRDIFQAIGVTQSPSPSNPNFVKFNLPNHLVAHVNGGEALDQRGSKDWNTWTWNSDTVSVVIRGGLIIEKDKSGEETTIEIMLADIGLRMAGFNPTTDGGVSFPKHLTFKSLSTGLEYKGKIKGASFINEIKTRPASDSTGMILDIRFYDGSKDSFSLVRQNNEGYTTERVLVANSLNPNAVQPVDMQVNQDRSTVVMNVNGNQFILTKVGEGQYQDNYGIKWISRKQVVGPMFFIQQN